LIHSDTDLTFCDTAPGGMTVRSSHDASRVIRGVVDAGWVRLGPTRALPTVLRSFGVEPSSVLDEFQLQESHFQDPENTVSMSTAGRLLGRCVERTGCDHFGLLVGQQAGASSLGALGFLVQSSETVGEALDAFARHLAVQDRGGVVWIDEDESLSTLGYTLFDSEVEGLDQILSCAIAIAGNMLRSFLGPQWHPQRVSFAFSPPSHVKPYREFFGVRPLFDAERTGIVFPARLLRAPVPGADELLRRLMEERVHELERVAGEDTVARVQRLLRSMATSPGCSVDAVSNRVGLHRRTLNRALAAAGTSFRSLRQEAQRELACQLLESTRTSVGEIATILGYSEAAAFTRAFQRWTGSTPTRWRAHRRGRSQECR
jgi:AraC-like DNA-binding protein